MSFTSQLPLTLCSSTCRCRPVLRQTPPASDSGSRTTVVRGHIVWLHAKIHTICVCFFFILTSFVPPEPVKHPCLIISTGKKEEVWVIDDLIIDGSSLHNPPVVVDSFEEGPNESNWLFFPGGNTGLYCPYQKTGL